MAAHQSCETAILLGLVLATALSSARAVKNRPRKLKYSIPDLPANLIVLYPSQRTCYRNLTVEGKLGLFFLMAKKGPKVYAYLSFPPKTG